MPLPVREMQVFPRAATTTGVCQRQVVQVEESATTKCRFSSVPVSTRVQAPVA